MNDFVELFLAASVDGLRDGAMQNIDGVVADVAEVDVGLGSQTLKKVLDEVRTGRCQLGEAGLKIICFVLN